MSRPLIALLAICAAACADRSTRPAALAVVVLGDPGDPRAAAAQEAIAHWNGELARLGLRLRLVSSPVQVAALPETALAAASTAQRTPWAFFATFRLRRALAGFRGDVIIALSRNDLISFGVPWEPGKRGIAGIRPADRPPLSLPNTVRNVVAHELGHVLGLEHNRDPAKLMCGRPAPCRPADFASETPRFFPLTPEDEAALRERWP